MRQTTLLDQAASCLKISDDGHAGLSKAEGGEKAANSPSGYSWGEGQKPVSKAYKDNWNAIYGKKKKIYGKKKKKKR